MNNIFTAQFTYTGLSVHTYELKNIYEVQHKERCSNAISTAQSIRHEVATNSDLAIKITWEAILKMIDSQISLQAN